MSPLLAEAGAVGAWQVLFFAALGAWLVGGAVRRERVGGHGAGAEAVDAVARPGYLAAVGAVLLFSAVAACWPFF